MSAKRCAIIIEETGRTMPSGETEFNVYLEDGDAIKARLKGIPPEEWSTAEFWAINLLQICGQAIQRSGAFYRTRKRD